jgi:hypothetical protein
MSTENSGWDRRNVQMDPDRVAWDRPLLDGNATRLRLGLFWNDNLQDSVPAGGFHVIPVSRIGKNETSVESAKAMFHSLLLGLAVSLVSRSNFLIAISRDG